MNRLIICFILLIIGAALPAPSVSAEITDILILPQPTNNNNSIPPESADDATICCQQFKR